MLFVGINDCRGVPGAVTQSAFRASYDSILTQVKATLPSVKIVCMGLFALGELWASSSLTPPHFAGNVLDAPAANSIELYSLQVQQSAIAHGCTYVDLRARAALAESVLNTPQPGVSPGPLTGDLLHPTAAGQSNISTTVRAIFQVV